MYNDDYMARRNLFFPIFMLCWFLILFEFHPEPYTRIIEWRNEVFS
jgi:hypothetical protein